MVTTTAWTRIDLRCCWWTVFNQRYCNTRNGQGKFTSLDIAFTSTIYCMLTGSAYHGLYIGFFLRECSLFACWSWSCSYVQAALYQTEFRPVPLEEFMKVGQTIYNKKMEVVRSIRKSADLGGKDPDHLVELCHEVILAFYVTSNAFSKRSTCGICN